MASYAVRYFRGDRRYKPVKIEEEQAQAMAERGEPMIYSEHRRAWAVARSLNRHERQHERLEDSEGIVYADHKDKGDWAHDEGFAAYDSAEDN